MAFFREGSVSVANYLCCKGVCGLQTIEFRKACANPLWRIDFNVQTPDKLFVETTG